MGNGLTQRKGGGLLGPGMLKKYWLVMFATFSNTSFLISQLSQVFYVQFQDIFQLTNTQMGFLEGFGNIGGFVGGIIGGLLADRFSPKKLTAIGCFVAAFSALLESVAHSYFLLLIIYFCLALAANVLLLTPYFKLIKLLGNSDEQGKLMTFSEAAYAIVTLVIQYGFLGAITALNLSFQMALRGVGILCILVGIGIWVFLKSPGIEAEEKRLKELRKNSTVSKKENTEPKVGLLEILKMPVTWCNVVATFCLNLMAQIVFTYMNPYLVGVMAFTAGTASFVAITMKNFFRIVVSPFGGMLRDKLGDSTIVFKVACVAMTVIALGMALLPLGGAMIAVLYLVLVALFSVGMYAITGLQYTLVEDAKVPIKYTGRLWGVVFTVNATGYMIRGAICGQLLDNFGNAGYRYIFIFLAVTTALCGASAFVLKKLIDKKKALGKRVQAEVDAQMAQQAEQAQ